VADRLPPGPRDWMPDKLMALIAEAVEARDFEAVPYLIALLAVKDPHQAEVVYESMMAVLQSCGESAATEGKEDG